MDFCSDFIGASVLVSMNTVEPLFSRMHGTDDLLEDNSVGGYLSGFIKFFSHILDTDVAKFPFCEKK